MKVWMAYASDNMGDRWHEAFVVGIFTTRELAVERALHKDLLKDLVNCDPCGPWVPRGENAWVRPGAWARVAEFELEWPTCQVTYGATGTVSPLDEQHARRLAR
jgi:hypothetical protein